MVKHRRIILLTLLHLSFTSGFAFSQPQPRLTTLPRLVIWEMPQDELKLYGTLLRDFSQATEPFFLVPPGTSAATKVSIRFLDNNLFVVSVDERELSRLMISRNAVPTLEDVALLKNLALILAQKLTPFFLSLEVVRPRMTQDQQNDLARIQDRNKWYKTSELVFSLVLLQKYLLLSELDTLQSKVVNGLESFVLTGQISWPDNFGSWYGSGIFRSQNPARLPEKPELSNISAVDLGFGGGRSWRVGDGWAVFDFYIETYLGSTFLANSNLVADHPAFGTADTLSQPFWEIASGARITFDTGGPYRLRLGVGLASALPSLLLKSWEPRMILRDGQILTFKLMEVGFSFANK